MSKRTTANIIGTTVGIALIGVALNTHHFINNAVVGSIVNIIFIILALISINIHHLFRKEEAPDQNKTDSQNKKIPKFNLIIIIGAFAIAVIAAVSVLLAIYL